IAVIAGWTTPEVGRQPYTVYGLLRTLDSASPIGAAAVGGSLIAFFVVYMLVFGAGTFYILRLSGALPKPIEPEMPRRPLRAAGITPAPALVGGEEDGADQEGEEDDRDHLPCPRVCGRHRRRGAALRYFRRFR